MIQVENVTKVFDSLEAVSKFTCSIPEGCIYGMVGSNGAGKSTLLRVITGIFRPEQGEVTIDEIPVYNNANAKAKLAFIPDELYFLPQSNLSRMASLYAANYKSFDKQYYSRLVKLFGLDAKANLNTFSKGMKRQAATILALSCRPKYILLDETFDGLDPVMRNLLKKIIYEEIYERNATAVITSHSLRELEDTCDQLMLLHKGGMILQSDVGKLKTSLYKMQLVMNRAYDRHTFKDIDILDFKKSGSVCNIIFRGDQQKAVDSVKSLSPLMFEMLPLSLDEIFIHEMEALGYAFSQEGGENNEE